MIHKTVLLPVEKVVKIQNTAKDFNCAVLNIAVAGQDTARVSVSGDDDDMKALFESIDETVE